jgi:hypothetical protein
MAIRPRPAHHRPSADALVTLVAESEPNNAAPTADSAALGDQASGLITPAGDVDCGLTPGDAQLLDAIGNHNGRYDVGDLQAYLQTVGRTL